jgi:23S rRNA (adenine2030-N6)-methyltransferase
MRSQDRMTLCEKHPGEYLALHGEFLKEPRVSTHELDGYTAIRAMLPPPEKRALILIDPSYEAQDEYEKIAQAIREALRRMPAATIAVWYPLTERARADAFLDRLAMLNPPPTFAAELTIASASSPSAPKMRGCGMAVVNPPWQIDQTLRPLLDTLASRLAQVPGGTATLDWIVRE